jgi:hypothetical protein
VSVIHIFPEAESMERHMFGVDELARKAFEYMEIVSFEIYGRPSEKTLAMMTKAANSGVAMSFKPDNIGGFLRLKNADEI